MSLPSVVAESRARSRELSHSRSVAGGCVHTCFEAQAAAHPDAVALACDGRHITYAALNERANSIAHALLARGVQPGEAVALALPRGSDAIAAMLGILKAGAAYLPLDPGYPTERLRFMVEDARAHYLIHRSELDARLPDLCLHTLAMGHLSRSATTDPCIGVDPEHIANIIYTSGSTGKPKGVLVPHRAVMRLVRGATYTQFGADQVFLHAAPLTFDAATFEVWGSLLNGGTCAILPPGMPEPRVLGHHISSEGVTTAWLTAALFNMLIDETPEVLSGLQTIITGGEALSPRHVHRALRKLPGVTLINGYGPTENTTFTCCYRIPGAFPADARNVPIGHAVNGTYLRVLNQRFEPVPEGEVGELCIGGAGLATGYLNRPDLTRERFIADPVHPTQRLYRSGDLVRQLSGGNYEFLGRMDRQVKVNGHRIELEEVEAVLSAHAAVKRCVVEVMTPANDQKLLAAFVVGTANASELRTHLHEQLPTHMRPARIVIIDEVPLTPNGKADRKALQELLLNAPEPTQTADDEVERWLAATWRHLLPGTSPARGESFLDLGGTSLDAVRLMQRIEERYGCELPLSALVETPTLQGLARQIREHGRHGPWSPLVPIRPGGSKPPLFFVHPLGGNVLGFKDFAQHLDDARPLFGLQAHGLISGQDPLSSIEAMAESYLLHLKREQPTGPYHLGGISLGGVIALEMALQLREMGEDVAYLLIGDIWFTRGPHIHPLAWHLTRLLSLCADVPGHWNRLRADREARQAADLQNLGKTSEGGYGRHVAAAHHQAWQAYEPRYYDGDITLVRSQNLSTQVLHMERCFGQALGWQQLTSGEVRTYLVPGTHHHLCYGDNAARFARIIESSLDAGGLAH